MPIDYSRVPLKLNGLTDREAIKDTLYRFVMSFDSGNKQLFESAVVSNHKQFSMQIGDKPKMEGVDAVYSQSFEQVGAMETQHTVSCVRIDIKPDGSSAFVTANAQNQHFKAGEGLKPDADNFLAGSFYEVDVIKEEGEWLIKHFEMQIIWTRGNGAVMAL